MNETDFKTLKKYPDATKYSSYTKACRISKLWNVKDKRRPFLNLAERSSQIILIRNATNIGCYQNVYIITCFFFLSLLLLFHLPFSVFS